MVNEAKLQQGIAAMRADLRCTMFSHTLRTMDGERVVDVMLGMTRIAEYLEPAAEEVFELDLVPGLFGGSDGFYFDVEEGAPRPDTITVTFGGVEPPGGMPTVGPGATRLVVRNHGDERLLFFAFQKVAPIIFAPLERALTGRELLHSPVFRTLFADEVPGADVAIRVERVSIVFTDLCGSTALYARAGDLQAFHMVREHFEVLARAIEETGGVWVKNIGDAVMASFPDAQRAVSGALSMLAAIRVLNADLYDTDLSIKIGLHSGPCIAVSLNGRLDFFGQVVNVAARVQALANAGELTVTDAALTAAGLAERAPGATISSQEVPIRGVDRPMLVHRVRP